MPLVLKRRLNETVVVSDRLKITVIEIGRGCVRLMFDGPRSMHIDRAECWSEPRWPEDRDEREGDEEVEQELGGEGGGHA